MLEKEIKMPIASTNTTSGLVSVLQLVDTTPSEMFATVRNDTSELEMQRITYPIELPKKNHKKNECARRSQLSAYDLDEIRIDSNIRKYDLGSNREYSDSLPKG